MARPPHAALDTLCGRLSSEPQARRYDQRRGICPARSENRLRARSEDHDIHVRGDSAKVSSACASLISPLRYEDIWSMTKSAITLAVLALTLSTGMPVPSVAHSLKELEGQLHSRERFF